MNGSRTQQTGSKANHTELFSHFFTAPNSACYPW